MVDLREQKRGKKTYYYLEHSLRVQDKVQKRKLYLGENLPGDLEVYKKRFLHTIYAERWFDELDKIQKAYRKERKSMPFSALEKEIEAFVVKFTYDTQRIEGSTLTLRETADLLQKGMSPAKPIQDIKEAEAHKKVFYLMLDWKKELTYSVVLFWHKQLLSDTKPDIAGKIRRHQVAIAASKFMPPSPVEVDIMLKEFFSQYNKEKKQLHPVELAALVHLRFVTIHPFSDGNGRISRLMMNFVLQKFDYPMLNIQYMNRNSYYNALERAQVKKEEHIFIQWFYKQYIKEQKKRFKIA